MKKDKIITDYIFSIILAILLFLFLINLLCNEIASQNEYGIEGIKHQITSNCGK